MNPHLPCVGFHAPSGRLRSGQVEPTTAVTNDAVLEAQDAATEPSRKVTQLEQAVLAGDTSITSGTLTKARAEAEFASLKVLAAQRGVDEHARVAHDAAVESLRADYEDHVEDLDGLREAYEWAVLAIAELHQAIEERGAVNRSLLSRGHALGHIDRSNATDGPFPGDRNRWRRTTIDKTYVDRAVEEGTRGFLRSPLANKAQIHALHTDERRAQLETLTGMNLAGQAKALLAEYVAAHQDQD